MNPNPQGQPFVDTHLTKKMNSHTTSADKLHRVVSSGFNLFLKPYRDFKRVWGGLTQRTRSTQSLPPPVQQDEAIPQVDQDSIKAVTASDIDAIENACSRINQFFEHYKFMGGYGTNTLYDSMYKDVYDFVEKMDDLLSRCMNKVYGSGCEPIDHRWALTSINKKLEEAEGCMIRLVSRKERYRSGESSQSTQSLQQALYRDRDHAVSAIKKAAKTSDLVDIEAALFGINQVVEDFYSFVDAYGVDMLYDQNCRRSSFKKKVINWKKINNWEEAKKDLLVYWTERLYDHDHSTDLGAIVNKLQETCSSSQEEEDIYQACRAIDKAMITSDRGDIDRAHTSAEQVRKHFSSLVDKYGADTPYGQECKSVSDRWRFISKQLLSISISGVFGSFFGNSGYSEKLSKICDEVKKVKLDSTKSSERPKTLRSGSTLR